MTDNVRNNLYIYDIATNSWTSGAPMLVGAESPGGAVVNGKLWVIGGRDQFGDISATIPKSMTRQRTAGPTGHR